MSDEDMEKRHYDCRLYLRTRENILISTFVLFFARGPDGIPLTELGVIANGDSNTTKQGTGEFRSGFAVLGLSGTFKLHVGRETVRLYQGGEQVWFGTGVQKGLEGESEIFLTPFYPL